MGKPILDFVRAYHNAFISFSENPISAIMASMVIYFITKTVHWIFLTYTMILFGRIIGSWFPRYAYHPVMRFLRFYSDPYLNIFRRLIPPIGGALDLSPMLGFFALQILERMVLGFLSGLF